MSTPQLSDTAETLAAIREDESVREDVETVAERDDKIGALARVVIAIADGRRPDSEDATDAGLESIEHLYDANAR